jgi:hypothetical protein
MVMGQGLRLGVIAVAAGLVMNVLACRALTSATWFLSFGRVSPLFFAVIVLQLVMITTSAESYWKRTTDPKNGQRGGRTERFRTPGPLCILMMR